MSISNIEKETIILFNEKESTANVYTYNVKLKHRLDALCASRSGEAKCIQEDKTGAVTYHIPKKWVKVNAPNILSEAQREVLRARLQNHVSS